MRRSPSLRMIALLPSSSNSRGMRSAWLCPLRNKRTCRSKSMLRAICRLVAICRVDTPPRSAAATFLESYAWTDDPSRPPRFGKEADPSGGCPASLPCPGGGQIGVEWVAGSAWNQWPNARGRGNGWPNGCGIRKRTLGPAGSRGVHPRPVDRRRRLASRPAPRGRGRLRHGLRRTPACATSTSRSTTLGVGAAPWRASRRTMAPRGRTGASTKPAPHRNSSCATHRN